MKQFKIITDTCSAMSKDLRNEFDVEYIPMSVSINEQTHVADLDWTEMSVSDYFNVMRNNTRILTSQINKAAYVAVFEQAINDGFDVLYIGCSSALSASVKASYVAASELAEKYPDAKVICIDSLISGLGLGYITIIASKLRAQGKTIDEVAAYVEENKLAVHQWATVGDLKFLKWSGRIKASTALFGTLFNIKPIIISDAVGRNVSVEKVKGRAKSLDRLALAFKECYNPKDGFDEVFIAHADCQADAQTLKQKILEINPNVNVRIGYMDPIVGASTGPDTIIVNFVGDKVTHNED